MPGVVVLEGPAFGSYGEAERQLRGLTDELAARGPLTECPLIV